VATILRPITYHLRFLFPTKNDDPDWAAFFLTTSEIAKEASKNNPMITTSDVLSDSVRDERKMSFIFFTKVNWNSLVICLTFAQTKKKYSKNEKI